MLKVVIIGASSAISEAVARKLAAQGADLYLVARDAGKLRVLESDLKVRGANRVSSAVLDVLNFEEHGPVFESALRTLGRIDLFMVCYGTLSNQAECESNLLSLRRELEANFVSAASLLTLAANTLETQKSGTIVAVSSVAGDRGRRSNYVYGSAKAALTAFMQGLRHRLHSHGVKVVTVKPGFVDSPMTAHLKKGLLWAKPDKIANGIVAQVIREKSGELYLPGFWSWIMRIIRWMPEKVFVRLPL